MIQTNDSNINNSKKTKVAIAITQLSKRDVYAVSDRRFIRKIGWIILALLIVFFTLGFIGIGLPKEDILEKNIIRVLNWVETIGEFIWFFTAQNKARKILLKETIANSDKLDYSEKLDDNNRFIKIIKGWFKNGNE